MHDAHRDAVRPGMGRGEYRGCRNRIRFRGAEGEWWRGHDGHPVPDAFGCERWYRWLPLPDAFVTNGGIHQYPPGRSCRLRSAPDRRILLRAPPDLRPCPRTRRYAVSEACMGRTAAHSL